MSLKEQFLADYGKDLPIDGGSSQALLDPIKLTTADSDLASMTMLEVMRYTYGALGWYWQVVQWDLVPNGADNVERVTVLTKHELGTDLVTERRNLYFDMSSICDRADRPRTIPMVRLPVQRKMSLPWQLGWFHFDRLLDNSAVDPGLGVSVAYSAPRAKMMVYVYDKGVG